MGLLSTVPRFRSPIQINGGKGTEHVGLDSTFASLLIACLLGPNLDEEL
jgi:hypothetical protein